jgi:hypothetical protein
MTLPGICLPTGSHLRDRRSPSGTREQRPPGFFVEKQVKHHLQGEFILLTHKLSAV